MKWWQNILPLQGAPAIDEINLKSNLADKRKKDKLTINGQDPEKVDKVLLIRTRLSRIFFLRRFFDYPISLNWEVIRSLGFLKIIKIGWTYLIVRLFPIKDIKSLEDFFY
jgi:hypothetical protein